MDNGMSLAAEAVAAGPMTAAQPSFNGHGWLVVINLFIMTLAALIMLQACSKLVTDMIRDRGAQRRGPLVMLLRVIALLAFGGMFLRTGVEALTLWGWNPLDPEQTGWYNTLKRMVDPFGAAAYIISACLFISTEEALVGALERKPFPDRLVAALPKLRAPAMLAALTLVAAMLVVSLR